MTSGEAAYLGYCVGNERMASWDSLTAEEKTKWDAAALEVERHTVTKPVWAKYNGADLSGRITEITAVDIRCSVY